ncbi:MAG: tetratricopeptide repeat protein, partial [Candidatus Subteraquimicrobiales bacterium]|nr:tetratricopeptide repeat protein [Candidatus Subteraquimicrobiales bacterium]
IYSDQNLINEAEQAFKKALELNPKNEMIYEALGGVYRDEGRYNEAEQAFKKALEIKPNNNRAYSALETIYFLNDKGNNLYNAYNKEAKQKPEGQYRALTISNYLKLKQILDKRNVRLVCVQYPMRSLQPLEKIFEGQMGVIFVDNEKVFRDAVRKWGYRAYFKDMFAVDFGHCTDKGNSLLAENIANAILKEIFKK